MSFEKTIETLLAGKSLTEELSRGVFDGLFRGRIPESDAKTLLLLLARKGETAEELTGCLKALRKLEPPARIRIRGLIDTCGTGGDGKGTVNISTLAAFVVAGAGGRVAKHGNRAISSRAGSSDLLEALGVRLDADREVMIQSIRKAGIGYFHAPFYHPVFARVQPLRRKLATRTIFNLLGPLVNPLVLEGQSVGVSKPEHIPLFSAALVKTGLKRGIVCHSRDGFDEISGSSITDAAWIINGKIRKGAIHPAQFGLKKAPLNAYAGGSIAQNKRTALQILQGKKGGPVFEMIALNAAAGLWASGVADNLEAGLEAAFESLNKKRAYEALQGLITISRNRK